MPQVGAEGSDSEPLMSSDHVVAVLAYNRRDLTLACPRSLRAQNVPDLVVDAYVLDDARRERDG